MKCDVVVFKMVSLLCLLVYHTGDSNLVANKLLAQIKICLGHLVIISKIILSKHVKMQKAIWRYFPSISLFCCQDNSIIL